MTATTTDTPHRYQRWDGRLHGELWTWRALVSAGIRQVVGGRKTRLLILSVMGVVMGGCGVLCVLSVLERVAGTPEAESFAQFLRVFLKVDLTGVSRIEAYREVLWRALFLFTIRLEMLWVLLVVARVGPGLISNDLKHGALPIYFAKPVTPLSYVTGKLLVMAAFVAMVTVVPNLLTLLLGTLLTGGLHTWGQLLSLGIELTLLGLMVCVVCGAIVLALSSMSSDYRYVTVAWVGLCLMSLIGQNIVDELLPAEMTTGWLGCISIEGVLVTVSDRLFGLREALQASGLPAESFTDALIKPVKLGCAATVLALWTGVAMVWSYRRVVKFSRAAANV